MKIIVDRQCNGFVVRRLGRYYVYLYINPITNLPIYVGKGTGKRCYRHLTEKIGGNTNLLKYNTIRKILRTGVRPQIVKVIENIEEDLAYNIEASLIQDIGTIKSNTGPLTNMITNPFHRHYDRDSCSVYSKIGNRMRLAWQNPHSKFNSKRFRKKIRERMLLANPRQNDHRSWVELCGKERAEKMKLERSRISSGKNNPNAKTYELTAPDGTKYVVKGQLKSFCKEHNLSLGSLKKTGGLPFNPKIVHSRYASITINTTGWCLVEVQDNRKQRK